MSTTLLRELAAEFNASYNAETKDSIWKSQSETFRRFWNERIRSADTSRLSDEECDAVIRILDRNGKGNTKDTEAIARVMVPQGAWRRMFNELHVDKPLQDLVHNVLHAATVSELASSIDRLYAYNEGRKNRLTGKSGNTISAFLAAFDPAKNLSIISLGERKTLANYLKVILPFQWDEVSIGRRIAETNQPIREALHELGVAGTARTVSRFCYWDKMRPLWQAEHTVQLPDRSVVVTVPGREGGDEDDEDDQHHDQDQAEGNQTDTNAGEIRESLQIQALLAEIGAQMGCKIWLPRSDRQRVLRKWKAQSGDLLDELPLSYDQTTMRTIEEIDVIWIKRRSIVRAFEVEHTTSVYSGLLRMADLLALQPNLNIRLHIVAPVEKRDKVFREIRRPVFSLLEGRPLSESCTYLSYDKVRELRDEKHLAHLSDDVIRVYEEAPNAAFL